MTTDLFIAAAVALLLAAAIIVALTKGDRPSDRLRSNSKSDTLNRDR